MQSNAAANVFTSNAVMRNQPAEMFLPVYAETAQDGYLRSISGNQYVNRSSAIQEFVNRESADRGDVNQAAANRGSIITARNTGTKSVEKQNIRTAAAARMPLRSGVQLHTNTNEGLYGTKSIVNGAVRTGTGTEAGNAVNILTNAGNWRNPGTGSGFGANRRKKIRSRK